VPHFYFDAVLQGQLETDPEGIELASREVARQEAVRAAAEMAKDRHLGESAKDITLASERATSPSPPFWLFLRVEERRHFAAGRHEMEATALAASVLVVAGAIVWSMLNARERQRSE